jgi:hypothetical protein
MKSVSYMLFVLILTVFRSYAHETKILWKMLHFDHGYVTCLHAPFYHVGDACVPIVAISIVYVSLLACCSALCIFEKHMLAFVDLIHALPTTGMCSEHGPICHLFKLILVIHANTSNGTNHIV